MTHGVDATGREDGARLAIVHDLLGKVSAQAERLAVEICVVLVALDLTVVLLEVVSRSLGSVVSWTEELARWLFIGMGYVGASVALRRGLHVGILFVVQQLPRGVKRLSILFGNLSILVFLGYFVWYSWLASLDAWRTTGDIIIIRLFWVKALLPLGGILMIVHTLYYVVGTLRYENPEDGLISQPEYEQALAAERQRRAGA